MRRELPVTALIGCPYSIINRTFEPRARYCMIVGREQHQKIEAMLKAIGLQVEVPVEIEVEGFKVQGVIDALDPIKYRIYEIKSERVTQKGFRQLVVYRDMLYLIEKRKYKIGFILYSGDSIKFIENFLYVPPVLEEWNKLVQVVRAIKEAGRLIRVECEDCKFCSLKGACKPEYRLTYKGLVKLP